MFYYLDDQGFLTETTTEHPEWKELTLGEYDVLRSRRAEAARVIMDKAHNDALDAAQKEEEAKTKSRRAKAAKLAKVLNISTDDLLELLNG